MANVVILKQPLYGVIVWNGIDFEYTPNQENSGNDVYIYSKVVNGKNTTFTQYVNPNNISPITKTLALTADAFIIKEVDIYDLVYDETDPFKALKIINVSGATKGSVYTDGSKIYYTPDNHNSIQNLNYTVTDKEFTVTGTFTLSVINGIIPIPYKPNLLTQAYNSLPKIEILKHAGIYWNSLTQTVCDRGPAWDSVDYVRYNAFCDVVLSGYYAWNDIYSSKPRYDSLYTTLCTYSGQWNADIEPVSSYDISIGNKMALWNAEYDELTGNAYRWDNNITNFNNLTSSIESNKDNYDSTYNNVSSNYESIWDTTELNTFSANYYGVFDNVKTLVTAGQVDWLAPITEFQNISSDISTLTSNVDETYSTVLGNSALLWDTTELNILSSTDFKKWDNVYNDTILSAQDWTNNSNAITSISSDVSKIEEHIAITYTTVYTNSADTWDTTQIYNVVSGSSGNWNEVYNTLSNNNDKWNTTQNISSIISNDGINFNSTYTTVSTNSGNWSTTDLNNLVSSNSGNWDSAVSALSNNNDKWNTTQTISGIISNDGINFNSTYTTVSTNSGNWGTTDSNTLVSSNSGNWDSAYNTLSSNYDKWNTTQTISGIITDGGVYFNSTYNTVSTNSGNWNNTDSNNLVSSNSGNWDAAYNTLSSNYDKWNNTQTISGIITDGGVYFNSTYNTVFTNSGNWDNTVLTNIVTANSANWNSAVSALSSNYDKWNTTQNISSIIEIDKLNFNGTYTTVSTNSGNWDTIDLSNISSNWNSAVSTLSSNYDNWNSVQNISGIISNGSINFNNTYTTVSTNSGNWDITDLNNIVSPNSSNWNNSVSALSSNFDNWNNTGSFPASVTQGVARYASTYNTICAISGNWNAGTIYSTISGKIAQFDGLRYSFFTIDSYSVWSSIITIYDIINNNYSINKLFYNSTTNLVNDNYTFWDTAIISTFLSTYSGNWDSLYNTTHDLSSSWTFDEKQDFKNTYSTTSSKSASWINVYNVLTAYSGTWNDAFDSSVVPSLSTQYLSGNPTISLSAKDIIIYGNLTVGQNVSTFGAKTSINTTNYTVSGFEVTNTDVNDCFVITKTGGINNVATFSALSAAYPIILIKANNKVIINSYDGPEALTISGNISASGTITKYMNDIVTLYTNNSSKYETAYTFATNNSAYLTNFYTASSNYDTIVNYINVSATNVNTLTSSEQKYNNFYNTISSQYNSNNDTATFIANSGSYFGSDLLFPSYSAKYETAYSILTTASAIRPISLYYNFCFNRVVNTDSVQMYIPNNIIIDSWTLFADASSTIKIDVLSGFYNVLKRGTFVSITNTNYISTNNTTNSTHNNLSTYGWTTNIKKDSVIKFNLTQNTAASSITVNLKCFELI